MSAIPPDRRSLWWGEEQLESARGSLPDHVDVLVVGAGITGLSSAIHLARAGRSPVVVDARRIGSGTTGHSTAKVSILQGDKLQRIRKHAGIDAVTAYLAAARAGQQWLVEVVEREGVARDYRMALTYAVTEAGAEKVATEREVSRQAGLEIEDRPQHDLPFPVLDSIGLADQLQVDPVALIRTLREELVGLGGVIIEGVRVTDVSLTRPWRVETTVGECQAEAVVLATQVPILVRDPRAALVVAHRSYAMAYEADPARVPSVMALSLDASSRSLRTATTEQGQGHGQGQGHFMIVGGCGHRVGTGGSTASRVRELDAWARKHLELGELRWSWSAQDYHLGNDLPSVGAVPGTSGTILSATGYDKWGMAFGAAAGVMLAGELVGERPAWAEALHKRSTTLGEVVGTATQVASSGARLVADRASLALPDPDEPPAEGQGRVEGWPVGPTAVANLDGRTCRVSGICTHLGGVLEWNDAERSWDCPLHGSRFTADGTRIEGPATADLATREV